MKFLSSKPFDFDWNAASDSDWYYIERNFIAAYLNSYKDSDIAQLAISKPIIHEAEKLWGSAYAQACQGNFKLLQQNIFNPLVPLLSHVYPKSTPEKGALSLEREALHAHFNMQKK